MNFTVIIPYSWTDPARSEALDFVRGWWGETHPVLVGHSVPDGVWSKGRAVGSVRADVQTDGLIIADSDAIITSESLAMSKAAVAAGAAWAMPHSRVIRLSRFETQRVFRLGADCVSIGRQRAATHTAPPGGGIVVLTTAAYDTVGGIDPRFEGWGGEDISFARALDTLVGVGFRPGGFLWHLWHPRTPRRPGNRASRQSEALAAAYLRAAGNPDAMRALVERVAP